MLLCYININYDTPQIYSGGGPCPLPRNVAAQGGSPRGAAGDDTHRIEARATGYHVAYLAYAVAHGFESDYLHPRLGQKLIISNFKSFCGGYLTFIDSIGRATKVLTPELMT